jgi:NADH-quinone oxidoreductase subunit C
MQITTAALLAAFPFLTAREGDAGCEASVNVAPENLVAFVAALRDAHGFNLLADLAGCDWGESASEGAAHRFGIVAHFARVEVATADGGVREVVRVGCNAADDAAPTLPSITAIFPAADWFEREAFDMFGIRFAGHPDLRRLLLWDEFPAHPLRKDFPLAGIETPFPAGDAPVPDDAPLAGVVPAPLEGGPFVAGVGETPREREPRAGDQSWGERK